MQEGKPIVDNANLFGASDIPHHTCLVVAVDASGMLCGHEEDAGLQVDIDESREKCPFTMDVQAYILRAVLRR